MYRLCIVDVYVYADSMRVSLPYNDSQESVCHFDYITESNDPDHLLTMAREKGFTPTGDVFDGGYTDGVRIGAVYVIEGIDINNSRQKRGIAWVEIRQNQYTGLDIHETIAPMTADEFEGFTHYSSYSDIGVADSGDDLQGNSAVTISGWHFYHILPLLGYTWQSFLNHMGIEGDEPEPFGFDDDSFSCSNCNVIDHRDNGYNYNERETPSGEYVGVNCGCFDEACKSEFADNANDPKKTITLDIARSLSEGGELEFVARYIGGMTDPGRGGRFNVDDGTQEEQDFGAIVCNGDPEEELAKLLTKDETAAYIFSHDDSGQFQTYFSIWKIIEE